MTCLPRANAATAAGWPDLVGELDRWGKAGRVAAFWWRDDDASAPSARLERMLVLAAGIPIALAVIPAAAEPGLAACLDEAPEAVVLQHGWGHVNHAENGRKSEFPATRPGAAVAAELAAGRSRLAALFGPSFLPVLVPPWNRFAAEFEPLLKGAGLVGLSALAPRRGAPPPPGIALIDVHVDLVSWRTGRGFIGSAAALAGILGHLRARRHGETDPSAATGILTHHLVLDAAAGEFLGQLRDLVTTHRAARWSAAAERLAVL